MARQELPEWPAASAQRFAAELRELREKAGSPSYRDLARRVHYSRTALSEAARGEQLPSLRVALAFAQACGGDVDEWRERWLRASTPRPLAAGGPADRVPAARSPWSPQAVEDGADPERSGCGLDAVTVDACKIAVPPAYLVGQVQLRFSPWGRAAWARFEGTNVLDRLATGRQVMIRLQMARAGDDERITWEHEYVNDYIWCDLLRVGPDPVRAIGSLFFDGELVGTAETLNLSLG